MVKDCGVRETTMNMVRDSRKAKDLERSEKLREEEPESRTQDLGLGLERAGLLPH